ncbi:RecT family recombinase [Endozoicomonas euniceicola]|uniref:Recombinase RecT n=1 Tax=Endozoicomonas euniceicola TaxID=1234143 RepID=A0ABY6GT51_9GAMM|nr:RecT family recombinase [Endozoicomonas euniceicola]UYM15942.1 recombinase RecT [Endozoicomonas euniceicola]
MVTANSVHESANDLVARFAERYGFGEDELLNTLAQTAFRQQNGSLPTREQLMSLLSVADTYGLNPFIRQIWALSDRRGGVLPVISIDGWTAIMNSYPQSDGMEFHYPDELIAFDEDMRQCHPWMECVIYRKDREHPIRVREYLDELYRPAVIKNGKKFPGPWQTCPKRMLRHKSQIQAIRIAYGLSGLFEPDEAERILETQMGEPVPDLREAEPKVVEQDSGKERDKPQPVSSEPDVLDEALAEMSGELLPEKDVATDEVPEPGDLEPQVLSFIDQIVDRAKGTGAFTAAQGFAQERFKDDGNALNYCLFRLDEAQAASVPPASVA